MKFPFIQLKANFLLFAGSSAFQLHHHSHAAVGNRASNAAGPLPIRPFAAPTRLLSSIVSIDVNAPRDVGAMEEWAMNCGVQRVDGFELASEDWGTTETAHDVGVQTTVDMAAGSPILFVPQQMIFSSNLAYQELGEQAAEAQELLVRLGGAEHLPEFYLVLKLLMEYEKGDQSPWFPWLNSLPRTYYNGASMTPFCYECLPPLVSSLAMGERVKFINFNQAIKQVNCLSAETKGNSDLVKWAFQIAYTRSFWAADGDKRIVPMGDMFNHATESNVELSYDEGGNCVVYTTRDVPAGSPLTMSYGDPTNPSFFFARYGFLDDTSPATFCKIMIKNPSSQLVDLGYEYNRMLFYKDTGEVSEEVWDVLLYQILGESNKYDVQKAFYQAHMNGDKDTKLSIHQQFYPETSAALRCHVDDFLAQLDELSDKAVGRDFNEHPRLPLILRHNEFVRSTFLDVKERL